MYIENLNTLPSYHLCMKKKVTLELGSAQFLKITLACTVITVFEIKQYKINKLV